MRKPIEDARKYLTEQEWSRLFHVIESTRDKAIFAVCYWRGLRASEVGRLQLNHWNQKDRRLYVARLKGSLAGEYALSPMEHRTLTAWLKVRGSNPGPLFTSRESGPIGRGISRQMLDRLMRRYSERAELPPHLRHLHALKHALGTHLFAKGLELYEVKDWLGHKDIKSTLVYAQIRSKRRDDAARKVYQMDEAA